MADLATRLDYERLSDLDLAALIARRDEGAIRLVTRRNNQRLYRAAWSILKDRADAEDAVQDAYLKAFAAIGSFTGGAALSTWLTRIVINAAIERRRKAERRARLLHSQAVAVLDDYRGKFMSEPAAPSAPDAELMQRQIKSLLEDAVAQLSHDQLASGRHCRPLRVKRIAHSDLRAAPIGRRATPFTLQLYARRWHRGNG